MKAWQKAVLVWVVVMAFCAASAWIFSVGASGMTAPRYWGWVALVFTTAFAVPLIYETGKR
jgi:hypothetical protein